MHSTPYDTIIRGGTVVTENGCTEQDLGLRDGKIASGGTGPEAGPYPHRTLPTSAPVRVSGDEGFVNKETKTRRTGQRTAAGQ